jgi:hypothetical protein
MEEPNSLKAKELPTCRPSGRLYYLWGRGMTARLNEIPAMNGVRHHDNDNYKKLGTVRPLDKNDPRNIDHPSHKEKWLELARVLGRLEAREEYAMIHKQR